MTNKILPFERTRLRTEIKDNGHLTDINGHKEIKPLAEKINNWIEDCDVDGRRIFFIFYGRDAMDLINLHQNSLKNLKEELKKDKINEDKLLKKIKSLGLLNHAFGKTIINGKDLTEVAVRSAIQLVKRCNNLRLDKAFEKYIGEMK